VSGRRALALATACGAAACAPLDPGAGPVTASPIVVVGSSGGPGGYEVARSRAQAALAARIEEEVVRREERHRPRALPAERVRDWAEARRMVDALVPGLLSPDEDPIVSARGETFIAGRVTGRAFDEAVELSRAAGRRPALRVGCVPLAVEGPGTRRLYELRELYGAALRLAFEQEGIVPLGTQALYRAIEDVGARADVALAPLEVAAACERLGADALVHGRIVAARGGVLIAIELRDATDGRVLGSIDGEASDAAQAMQLARRHALVLKLGLGVERLPRRH
jgi:hypothetical protein